MALLGCPNDPTAVESETETNVSDTETPITTTGPMSTSTTADPDSSSTTEAEEEESSSTTGDVSGACGMGRACLGPTPLGWTGPVVIAKGDVAEALPNCQGPWGTEEFTRLEGYNNPPPSECTCSCELQPGACSMYTYNSTTSQPDYCYASYGYPTEEGCFALSQPVTDGFLMAQSYVNFGAGACDQQASETVPEIPWEAVAKSCMGSASDESCDLTDRICYELPAEGFESQICFIAQGDVPCPPGTDYLEKTIRFSAIEDTRDCSTCQCGQLNYCLNEYDYYTTADCSGEAAGSVSNAVCLDGVTASAVMFDFTGVSCPITSKSEPEGEATPLDPWTYCCSEPI